MPTGTYDAMFSVFDPRPYAQRALSDDFLNEAKRAVRDRESGARVRPRIPHPATLGTIAPLFGRWAAYSSPGPLASASARLPAAEIGAPAGRHGRGARRSLGRRRARGRARPLDGARPRGEDGLHRERTRHGGEDPHPGLEPAEDPVVTEPTREPVAAPSAPPRRWGRRVLLALGGSVLLLALVYYLVTLYQVWCAGERDEARDVDAIVVLGAAQYDGRPSPLLATRLDHALNLYRRGHAGTIVVTGGKQRSDRFTEAEVWPATSPCGASPSRPSCRR